MSNGKNGSPRKAIILTADKFEDLEVYYPLFRFREEGWHVDVAAPAETAIHGKHGYELNPDIAIEDVDPDLYDLLIIPGGSAAGAPSTVRGIAQARDIAASFMEKNKPVASICHGPYTLISADLVNGRRLTSYPRDGVPEEIREAGGVWEDKEVVVDGNLITSRRPGDLPAFTREILRLTSK